MIERLAYMTVINGRRGSEKVNKGEEKGDTLYRDKRGTAEMQMCGEAKLNDREQRLWCKNE